MFPSFYWQEQLDKAHKIYGYKAAQSQPDLIAIF